jgi:hypothetical protein
MLPKRQFFSVCNYEHFLAPFWCIVESRLGDFKCLVREGSFVFGRMFLADGDAAIACGRVPPKCSRPLRCRKKTYKASSTFTHARTIPLGRLQGMLSIQRPHSGCEASGVTVEAYANAKAPTHLFNRRERGLSARTLWTCDRGGLNGRSAQPQCQQRNIT